MGKRHRRPRPTVPTISLPHTPEVPFPLYQAARVSEFMREAKVGRWRLVRFEVTDEDYNRKMRDIYFSSDHPEQEMARSVPTGEYVTLQRRMIETEVRDAFEETTKLDFEDVTEEQLQQIMPPDARWIPVMSDTPAEILEHGHALVRAKGRVLITGLGLGCLPHALLTKPEVTSIDIIEIDPQVIRLTGKYLRDPKVTIHQGSAVDPLSIPTLAEAWMQGWDYAWHDIWSHVAARNLDDDTAEHGISYGRLFRVYKDRVPLQAAWAYDQAQAMRVIQDNRYAEELEFRATLRALPVDEAVEVVYHRILASKIKSGINLNPFPDAERGRAKLPDEFVKALDPEGGLRAHIYAQLSAPDFWEKFDSDMAERARRPEALGRPNAHLEAT